MICYLTTYGNASLNLIASKNIDQDRNVRNVCPTVYDDRKFLLIIRCK